MTDVLTAACGACVCGQALDLGWRIERVSGRDAVSDAMVRGWWTLTEELVSAGRDHGVDLSSSVHQASTVIRRQLQTLAESLQRPKVSTGIPPAFEWVRPPNRRCCRSDLA